MEENTGKTPADADAAGLTRPLEGAVERLHVAVERFTGLIDRRTVLDKVKDDYADSNTNTQFAYSRTAMAADRTLQAWVRTALSMISFGFTIGKLGQAFNEIQTAGPLGGRTVEVATLAYFLVVLGTLSLAAASIQYWLRIRQLRAQGLPRRISLSFIVANILTVVGGTAFVALVMKL